MLAPPVNVPVLKRVLLLQLLQLLPWLENWAVVADSLLWYHRQASNNTSHKHHFASGPHLWASQPHFSQHNVGKGRCGFEPATSRLPDNW